MYVIAIGPKNDSKALIVTKKSAESRSRVEKKTTNSVIRENKPKHVYFIGLIRGYLATMMKTKHK